MNTKNTRIAGKQRERERDSFRSDAFPLEAVRKNGREIRKKRFEFRL